MDTIQIRGARTHNLKNIDLDLPRDKLIVITGLSGSGKSSLAFDTIYAEGQRRYVESLSVYARQFLSIMEKPDTSLDDTRDLIGKTCGAQCHLPAEQTSHVSLPGVATVIDRKKVFLASSEELAGDRQAFEIFVGRKNKDWVDKGVFIELIVWEDFLDALAPTRLQDEYNRKIRECDLFVMLFWTKVGRYTEEEFETAFGQFQATRKPFIFTYFKDAPAPDGTDPANAATLAAFKVRLNSLGHFCTRYHDTEGLQLHFSRQLDKLVDTGFIEFKPDRDETEPVGGDRYEAKIHGSGVIAQGLGAMAAGPGGVVIGGNHSGDINLGTRIDTGGGAYVGGPVNTGGDFIGRDRITTHFTQGLSGADLESLFARLLAEVVRQAPAARKAEAVRQVYQLKDEAAKGDKADDGVLARIVNGLADLVPEAVGTVVSLFATPILSGIAGPVTKIVLDKLKGG